jgi:hypothetical protein
MAWALRIYETLLSEENQEVTGYGNRAPEPVQMPDLRSIFQF